MSACFVDWAHGVAADEDLLRLITRLPVGKRQPNLVFASARWVGIEPGPFPLFRERLLGLWPQVETVALSRSTQTNEAGRDAVLLPLLAALPQPLALIEVGAAAGLCLYPDRYSYQYSDHPQIDPDEGASTVVLRCEVTGPVPIPAALPTIVQRAGVDLHPIDLRDEDEVAWLETLIWPEHDERRARLRAAAAIVVADPPSILTGDLNERVRELVAAAPTGSTPVVFHSAVMPYLDLADRILFEETVRSLDCVWIANESPGALPSILEALPSEPLRPQGAFVVSMDGIPHAYAGGHGQWLRWFGR